MAELNQIITIPKQETAEALLTACQDAFAKASGLVLDLETDTFYLNSAKTLGIKFKVERDVFIYAFGVDYEGIETKLESAGSLSTSEDDCCIMYNISAKKTVFAFSLTNMGTGQRRLSVVIAKDAHEKVRLLETRSNVLKVWNGGMHVASASFSTFLNTNISIVSMANLPAFFDRCVYDELFFVVGANAIYNDTDASIYSGGKLYKVITNGYFMLAMPV